MLPPLAVSIRRRDSSPAVQTCSSSAAYVPPCPRGTMQDDAAGSVSSDNQVFSLSKLTMKEFFPIARRTGIDVGRLSMHEYGLKNVTFACGVDPTP